jgi:ubiquinone/menaquinone biosynthesis C-methylase UbiE
VAPEIAPEILAYYSHAPEHKRLHAGAAQLEFARTQEIIAHRLGAAKCIIIDVGGGPGAYSAWLADLGHEVHLVDPVPAMVRHARSLRGAAGREIASCAVGDARSLDRGDQSVGAVLMLGPLYHLIAADDRRRALQEAFRVLVPGGMLFAAAISRFASALDGLVLDFFADPVFVQMVERDLAEGIHENKTGKLDHFTTAKFHRPDELAAELNAAGFCGVSVLGIEGPGWLLPDFEDRWQDPRRREDVLRTARALEAEPSILAISAHLLAVGRRPIASL